MMQQYARQAVVLSRVASEASIESSDKYKTVDGGRSTGSVTSQIQVWIFENNFEDT